MSRSREEEEWNICADYLKKETDNFTSQGLITEDDIFLNEDTKIKAFFMSHYANLPDARLQASRGDMERDLLIQELEARFDTDISKADFNKIIRTYKRHTLPFNEWGEWQPQEQDRVVSFIKRRKSTDQFMNILSKSKLKIGNMYIVYQLLHKHFGLKPRGKQMFTKVINKFKTT